MRGRWRGFGLGEMATPGEAAAAIEQLNGKEFAGRNLTVNEARPRTDRPGGGYGGGGGGGGGHGGGGGGWGGGGGGGCGERREVPAPRPHTPNRPGRVRNVGRGAAHGE